MGRNLLEALGKEHFLAKLFWTSHEWPDHAIQIGTELLLLIGKDTKDWLFCDQPLEEIENIQGRLPTGLSGEPIPCRIPTPPGRMKFVGRRKRTNEMVPQCDRALVLCYFPGTLGILNSDIVRQILSVEIAKFSFWEFYVHGYLRCFFNEDISPVTPIIFRVPNPDFTHSVHPRSSFATTTPRGQIEATEITQTATKFTASFQQHDTLIQNRIRLAVHWYGKALSEQNEADRFMAYYISYEVLAGQKRGTTQFRQFLRDLKGSVSAEIPSDNETLKEIKERRDRLVHEGDISAPFPTEPLRLCVENVLLRRMGMPGRPDNNSELCKFLKLGPESSNQGIDQRRDL